MFLGIGFIVMFNKYFLTTTIAYCVAILFIVVGLVFVYNYKGTLLKASFLTLGTISMVLGSVLVIYPESFDVVLPITIGIWMIINSMITIQLSLSLKKVRQTTWILSVLLSIMSVICGILIIIKPQLGTIGYNVFLGTLLSIYAVTVLMNLLIFTTNYRKVINLIKE